MVYDYIIIGSGFGGSVAGLRLVEKGYKVLTIEQGKRFNPEDFPKSNRNIPKYLWYPPLRLFGFQRLSFFTQASILSGAGVGGGSLVYANTLFIPPDDFFRNEAWAAFGDWKTNLQPYYEKASFMLGREKYRKKNREDELLEEIAGELNACSTFETVHVAVNLNPPQENSDPYFGGEGPIRKKCVECGGCMVGCRENAKNSLDRNYLWFAEKMGLEILPETKAEKISFEDGIYTVDTFRITSFLKGKRKIFRAKGLIVAGGTLGTLELLLKQKYKYKSLPLLSDKLGYELRTNSESLCAVSSTREKMNNGLAITSVFEPDEHTHVEIVKYPDRSDALKWFFGLSVGGASSPLLRTMKLAVKTLSHPAAFMKTLFNFKWPTNLVIFLVMQNMDNAMKMIWKKNLFGGTMRIDNKGKKRAPAFIAIGQEVMERYAAKTGGIAQNILLEVFFDRPTTAHILGGCPMSDAGENGVVNSKLQVHGYPGMYIMDGSIIQGNIGVNPSLTITATAEYAMSKIPDQDLQDSQDLQVKSLSKKLLILEEEWKKKRYS